jgi:hypothetical protein
MKGCLPTGARVLAVVLAVVFVVTLPISLVAFDLGRLAFSPERMTRLLTDTIGETGGLRRLMLDSLSSPDAEAGGGLSLGRALSFLTPEERDALGSQLTPPGWSEDQLGGLVSSFYEWIDNDRARPVFTVDISPVKVSLLSGGAEQVIETVVDSWPACSVAEVAQMSLDALLGQGELTFCEPPEPLRSGLVGILNVSVATSLRALPDHLTLGPSDADAPAPPSLMATKERVRRVRALAAWSWLLSPVILGLIMALVIRSWREVALWWGIPILVGGLAALVGSAALRLLLANGIRSIVADASMPLWIGTVIQGLAAAMLAVAFRQVAIQAMMLAAVGGVVLGVGLWLARREAGSSASGFRAGPSATSDPDGKPRTPGMYG